jgi:hypothetical protein
MHYSLVHRFRGTLVGALVGEAASDNEKCWSKMAELGVKSLIELGRFDLEDWLHRSSEKLTNLNPSRNISPKVILTTLPVALFFHDNKNKLHSHLISGLISQHEPEVRDSALACCYAIAQSLAEKLEPQTLIPEIISFLGETTTLVPQNLSKVNELLHQGAGIERVKAELNKEEMHSYTVAMAFYCFLSTLEDFRLSVLRARKNDLHFNGLGALGAITGALSGAYNSSLSIPITWQSAKLGMGQISEMVELSDLLLAVWSGVYNFPNSTDVISQQSAIASPHVIRLR